VARAAPRAPSSALLARDVERILYRQYRSRYQAATFQLACAPHFTGTYDCDILPICHLCRHSHSAHQESERAVNRKSPPKPPRSLATRAYEALKQDIVVGELPPGELVVEADLARRYGLGKTPIREALQALRREGLVESVPRAGYIVSRITPTDVQELFQLRVILETAAAELAATHASDEDLQRLSEAVDFHYVFGDHDSYRSFLNANTRFHYMVAESSGNGRLARIIHRLMEDLERLFHLELDVGDSAEEMVGEHKALVSALRQRDPEKARQAMRAQVIRSKDRVLKAIAGPKI